jgi:hypothetical protein
MSTAGLLSDLRECRLEALVEVVGEQLHLYLSFLPGLSDLLGRTGAYCGT